VTGSAVTPGPPLQRRAEPALTRSLAHSLLLLLLLLLLRALASPAMRQRRTYSPPPLSPSNSLFFFYHTLEPMGGPVADWLACWTQAQKGPGSNRSRDAVV